jgi:hypothetical protein
MERRRLVPVPSIELHGFAHGVVAKAGERPRQRPGRGRLAAPGGVGHGREGSPQRLGLLLKRAL